MPTEPVHEAWCCRSPESQCAKAGGCSGSCNCDAGGDQCSDVTLPSGDAVRVRGRGALDAADIAALAELVEAARAKAAALNPPDPDAAKSRARLDMVRRARGVSLREMGAACGVKFSVLFRAAQGRMPGEADRAAVEAWLAETCTPAASSGPEPTGESGHGRT